MDTKLRTWIKALCWQAMGLTTMFLVGFVVTGSVTSGGLMAVINTLIGLIVYFLYERVWNRISWGRADDRGRGANV